MKGKKNIKHLPVSRHGQKSKIKNLPQKDKILKLFFIIIIFSFLFANIFFSQLISPLFFRLVDNDKKAVIEFLEKIKTLPQFSQELEKYKKIYGKSIDEEVFAKERQRKQMVKKLEQILEKNPKARDVLYNLYLLYNEMGDKIKAQKYLERARAIDPNIHSQD